MKNLSYILTTLMLVLGLGVFKAEAVFGDQLTRPHPPLRSKRPAPSALARLQEEGCRNKATRISQMKMALNNLKTEFDSEYEKRPIAIQQTVRESFTKLWERLQENVNKLESSEGSPKSLSAVEKELESAKQEMQQMWLKAIKQYMEGGVVAPSPERK